MNDLKNRTHRISGQIDGIEKMIKSKRDCLEIIQQIVATREALRSLGIEILKNEALCMNQKDVEKDPEKLEKILTKIFKIS